MRGLIPGALVLLLLAVITGQQQGTQATHDGTGGHIDQISIDVGPHGVAQGVTTNGVPATGDRDGDAVADAEGYDTPDPGDAPGVCANGLDDDLRDSDGDATPDAPDGVIDDGCVVPLSPLETCIEIIDDGVLNADEDAQVGGKDRAVIDIIVGAQPGPGGGVPADRVMSAWQYSLAWQVDVLDVDAHDGGFLILAGGGGQPFTSINSGLPGELSPFGAAVSDAGQKESGPGVLARITIEGNASGLATRTLVGTAFYDDLNLPILVNKLNSAYVAVSRDNNGDTDLADAGERFSCADLTSTPTPIPLPAGCEQPSWDWNVLDCFAKESLWHRETSASVSGMEGGVLAFNRGCTGPDVQGCNYETGATASGLAVSSPLSLPSLATLTFKTARSTESISCPAAYDRTFVLYSFDGGNSFTPLNLHYGQISPGGQTLAAGGEICGQSLAAQTVTVPLPDGVTDIAFKFDSGNPQSNDHSWQFIDDLAVVAGPPPRHNIFP